MDLSEYVKEFRTLQETQNKALAMTYQVFDYGSEKLRTGRKPAVKSQDENADDDSKV